VVLSTSARASSDYALYDEAGIFERTGVTPCSYPEYAALRGDPSDNLPGFRGSARRRPRSWLPPTANLETIFEHLDDLPPKQRQTWARRVTASSRTAR